MLDAGQAAELLGVSEETVRRWLRQGLLSGSGADAAHFEREALARWARERGLRLEDRARSANAPLADPLADALLRGAWVPEGKPASASQAIEMAVAALDDLPISTRQALLVSVMDRERLASTALGGGVAVPHPRLPRADLLDASRVCLLIPAEPIDWVAPDERLVDTVIAVLAHSAAAHLAILSRVARIARNPEFRIRCGEARSKAELAQALSDLGGK